MTQLTPTTEQIEAAEDLLLAQCKEAEIEPIVTQYENEILRRKQFHIDTKLATEFGMEDKVILSTKETYLLSDNDLETFISETYVARDAAGLVVEKPNFCPLLVAKNARIKAENRFIQKLAEAPGLGHLKKIHLLTLDERKRVIDLGLGLMAPYLHTAREIMDRVQSVTA